MKNYIFKQIKIKNWQFYAFVVLVPFVALVYNILDWKDSDILLKLVRIIILGLSIYVSFLVSRFRERFKIAKQQGAQDAAILSSMDNGLIVTDQVGHIIKVNRAFEKLLGFKAKEVNGKYAVEAITILDDKGKPYPPEERILPKVLVSGKAKTSDIKSPYYFVRKDKTKFPAVVSVTPIFTDGQLSGVVGVFRDVSKEIEIDRVKTEFVSLASHQLRTPPTAIKWYTERLLAEKVGKLNLKQQDYFSEIRKSNERMIRLVNDLLNTSRIEMGVFSIEPKLINILALIKKIVADLPPEIAGKKIKFVVISKTPRVEINADETLIYLVLQNLISNAGHYTPQEKTVKINVMIVKGGTILDQKRISKGCVVVKISDEGYGIPVDQKEKIFTKFFRADNVRAKHTDGTGLGLYIVKSILDHSGGDIWFYSKEDIGTTFYVSFPLSGMKQKITSKTLIASNNPSVFM